MLTAKQTQVFDYVAGYVARTGGIAPSFTEIGAACGMHTKRSTHWALSQLEARGYIRRLKYKTRAIEIVRRPFEPGMRQAYFVFNDDLKALVPWDGKRREAGSGCDAPASN